MTASILTGHEERSNPENTMPPSQRMLPGFDQKNRTARVDTTGALDPAPVHVPQGWTLEEIEKAVVLQTLDRYQGNRTRTAKSLGISVRTLQRRLKSWNKNQTRLDT